MKLATLKDGGRDGRLIVVSRDLARAVAVPAIAPTLQAALDEWPAAAPRLAEADAAVNAGRADGAFALDVTRLHSPLPRAYQFADGSAYLNHVQLVRRARNAEMPASFWTDPLMYQGGSDGFLGPCDPIVTRDEAWGIDFEGEVAVIVDDVPMGVPPERAGLHIRLVMLLNDVSLRHLIPGELTKGFGFLQSKPASSCSPVAVTPDELGGAWDGARLRLPLVVHLNGEKFGAPQAGEGMVFDFAQLIAHAARTRRLAAGSVIGSGTVSNPDADGGPGKPIAEGGVGYTCLAELRTVEQILYGQARTPFLRFGDRVHIEMLDGGGTSIFGAIDQQVVRYSKPE